LASLFPQSSVLLFTQSSSLSPSFVKKSTNESVVPAPLHSRGLLDGDCGFGRRAGCWEGQSCPALVSQGRAFLLFRHHGRIARARLGPALVLDSAARRADVRCARRVASTLCARQKQLGMGLG